MRPPSRQLAPGAGTARLPPLGHQGAAPGDQRAPPTPPPSPSGPRADGGRPKRRRPRTPPREAAAPGVRGHRSRGKRPRGTARILPPCPLPTDGGPAGAQDGANGTAPSEASQGKAGARTRARGFPPPFRLPPRRTDPLAADRAAPDAHGRSATPTAVVYPEGAHRRQRMAGRRPTGRGGGGRRISPPDPPLPSLRATGATLRPPGAEGTPPLPQKGPRRGGGGMRLDLHTARPSAPSRLLPRGSRLTGEPTPARRSGARTKPWGGRRQRTRTVWGPRSP